MLKRPSWRVKSLMTSANGFSFGSSFFSPGLSGSPGLDASDVSLVFLRSVRDEPAARAGAAMAPASAKARIADRTAEILLITVLLEEHDGRHWKENASAQDARKVGMLQETRPGGKRSGRMAQDRCSRSNRRKR